MKSTAPLNEAVKYKNVLFKKGFITDLSPYMGWPDDEKDERWDDLYRCTFAPYSSTTLIAG